MSDSIQDGQATSGAEGASRIFPKVDYAPNPYFEPSAAAKAVPAETATGDAGPTGGTEGSGDGETFVSEDARGSVDFNSPEFKHLQASYTKARQRDKEALESLKSELEKLRAEVGSQKAEPAAAQERAETPSAPSTAEEFYSVNLDSWTPTIQFPEGSDLAGYEEQFAPAIKAAIQDGIGQVLAQFSAKAKAMESAQRQATAVDKIRSFENEISVHPEFENKLPEIQELASKFRSVAQEDPETWIALVEAKTGLRRGWQEGGASNVVPINSNLAAKAKQATPRPTRPATQGAAPKQFPTVKDGIDAAFRQLGLGR